MHGKHTLTLLSSIHAKRINSDLLITICCGYDGLLVYTLDPTKVSACDYATALPNNVETNKQWLVLKQDDDFSPHPNSRTSALA
jgi:hypothetical protein